MGLKLKAKPNEQIRVAPKDAVPATQEQKEQLKLKADETKLREETYEQFGKDVEIKEVRKTFDPLRGMVPAYGLVDKTTGEPVGTQNWASVEEAQAGKNEYVLSKQATVKEEQGKKAEFERKEAVSEVLRKQYPGWDKARSNTKEADFMVLEEFAKMADKPLTAEFASQLFQDPKFKEGFEGTASQMIGELNKEDNVARRTRVASYIVAASSVLGPLAKSILPALAVSVYGKKMGVDPALIAASAAFSGVGAAGESARLARLAAGPNAPQGPTPSGATLDTATTAERLARTLRTGLDATKLIGTGLGAIGEYIGSAQERTAEKEAQRLAKTEKLTALESDAEKAKRLKKELALTQPEERAQLAGQKTQQERQIAQLKANQDREDIEASGEYIKKRIAGSGVQQKLKARMETEQASSLAGEEQALGEITRKQELLPKLQAIDTEAAEAGATDVERAQAFVPAEESVQDKSRKARLRAGYTRGGSAIGATILGSL